MTCHDIQLNGPAVPQRSADLPESGHRSALDAIGRTVTGLFDIVLKWQERAAQRSRLWSLDDRTLRDVGLTRDQIAREASKPFWQG